MGQKIERLAPDERFPQPHEPDRSAFDDACIAIWEEDFSEVVDLLDGLRAKGVTDLRAHLAARPELLGDALDRVRVVGVNRRAVEMFEAPDAQMLTRSLANVFVDETASVFVEELAAIWEGRRHLESETTLRTLKGRPIEVAFTMAFDGGRCERTIVSLMENSAAKARERRLHRLLGACRVLSRDVDRERMAQHLAESARKIAGADFCAFFYNDSIPTGDSSLRYALDGVPSESFWFGLPRGSPLFDGAFNGAGVFRSDDMRTDPCNAAPAQTGAPPRWSGVASYLSAPVMTPSGVVHGGLFLGHEAPGVFDAEVESAVVHLAEQAGIAFQNAEQRDSAARLEAIIEGADHAIIARGASGAVTVWNKGAEQMFGYTANEMIGQAAAPFVPSDREEEERGVLGRVLEGCPVEYLETVRMRRNGDPVDVSITASAIACASGDVVGVAMILRDIAERKQAERRQEMLSREIEHRAKNLYAVAMAVVSSSFSDKKSVAEAREAVMSRLLALSEAHVMMCENDWRGAELGRIVRAELKPYGEQAVIDGPEITLTPQAAQNFALALHELATNAAKHGALSNASGQVRVRWRIGDAAVFDFEWREEGGPPITGADAPGYGSTVLKQVMAVYVDTPPRLEFQPTGLVYALRGSLENVESGDSAASRS